ncbi:MAG: glycosyltransferase family 4 protein [Elainellaceae cyanobacterium]
MINILVAQLGARKHYQEPTLFHQWEILDTLHTDFYAGNSWPFILLRKLDGIDSLPTFLKKASNRYEPKLDTAKVIQFPWLGYQYAKNLRFSKSDNVSSICLKAGKSFCHRIIQHGLGEANTVYGFNGACLELFRYAKEQGLRCILDQTLAERSYYYQLLQEEMALWPVWASRDISLTEADVEIAEREQQEQDLADHIICGSYFVKDSLRARGVKPEKISVVPLGKLKAETSFIKEFGSPWKKRKDGLHILFAGSVGLRKGIPYLLEALQKLKGQIPFICKVAGTIEIKHENTHRYSDVCQFLGRVPRSDMAALYQWADVFVLPSICEGSAMVTYEALQHGLPVITTDHAGSIISNYESLRKWIVPIRDSPALRDALLCFYDSALDEETVNLLQNCLVQSQQTALETLKQAVMYSAS